MPITNKPWDQPMATRDAVRDDLKEMLIVLANLWSAPDGVTELNAEYFSSGGHRSDKYSVSFRRELPVDVRSATTLSSEKRPALAVLLNDPGAANALADYLQEIGVIPTRDDGRPYSDSW